MLVSVRLFRSCSSAPGRRKVASLPSPKTHRRTNRKMAKSLVFLVIVLSSTATAFGQNGYLRDNIDLNAVEIPTPTPVPPKSATRKLYVYTPGPDALIHLTSLTANPSLVAFTTGDETIDSFIVESGKRNSVDPLLLYSIMHQESSFKA